MDNKKPNRSDPILSRRQIYLWGILTGLADFPFALTLYLNSTTTLQILVRFIVGLPLGAIIIFSIVRWFKARHDQKSAKRPPDPP